MREYVKCDDCPCMNQDYEQGSTCNLGYGVERWGGDIGYKQVVGGKWHLNQRYNHQTQQPTKVWEFFHDWVYCVPREACKLEGIVCSDRPAFAPEAISDVLEERCAGLNCEHGKLVAHG